MATLQSTDPAFIYHNTFENSFQNSIIPFKDPISDMSIDRDNAVANDPALQRFTATGRPIPHPAESRQGRAWNSLAAAESFGAAAPNLLPVRFTDDSLIMIPVLPPDAATGKVLEGDSDEDQEPIKAEPKKKFGFFRRKSSSSSTKKNQAFVMKEVTRRDYLKYYAKDEEGNYTGTMDPAPDCILNNEKDRFKRRKEFASREAKSSGWNAAMMI